ncbi:hypothetical protein [Agrilutibacter solisilvae]|uniref:Uncharacterized protein n=1 Tax=Agrilutibacter solisilvae TaxID=2763317 RepID=A0A974XYA0_9GAMM|nr:hypothetical protein [Lysobacter solisilvae]QSX77924.1 hypothetical protein I8J32_014535 [Lysobacter solisilvae]
MTTHPVPQPRRGRNPWRPLIWGGAAALLLLPAVAMQFTHEVVWTGSDFIAMGVMLGTACALYELATWLSGNTVYRMGFAIAVATGFLTVWVNLAVGMFGSEHNPLNLMFGGVLLVAAAGALAAKFRARGMARAMAATALAQLLAAGVGLALGGMERDGPGIGLETFLTAGFAVPWMVAALVFSKAARDEAAAGGTP